MGASPSVQRSAGRIGLSALNLEALQFVRETWELPSEIWVRVANPLGYREIHVAEGQLVGGTSTVEDDRLGILLAEEGRYDVDLLEPMAREAQVRGVRFGELLVVDGLLSRAELQSALERQATTRLLRLLTMPGLATIGGGVSADLPGQPVGALVIGFFRSALAPMQLGPLVVDLEQRHLHLTPSADHLPRLGLSEEELLSIGRDPVIQGRTPFALASEAESHLRLICGLVGLGVLQPDR